MAEEKEVKKDELSDEQTNDASGGLAQRFAGSQGGNQKRCAGSGCKNMIPDYPGNMYCDTCKRKYGIQVFV